MPPLPTTQQLVDEIVRLNQVLNAQARVMHATRRKLYRLEAIERMAKLGRAPRMEIDFRSQFGEDIAIYDLVDAFVPGFYIEVGAFDGRHFSVSWIFDALGWDGLLIEPLPERHAQCVKNRPFAHVVHAALGNRSATGQATFTVVEGDGINGMFSFLSTVPSHLDLLKQSQATTKTVQVPLANMDKLLQEHPAKPSRVDVAVIDVEGGEIDVLEGFDLERWKPRVLMLEDNQKGQDPRLEQWMQKNAPGYMWAGWVDVNRVYIRSDDAETQRRMQGVD